MALIGGIDAQVIDMPEADEALIRQEVRNCIDTYCPAGSFIPCIPNIQPMHADVRRSIMMNLKLTGDLSWRNADLRGFYVDSLCSAVIFNFMEDKEIKNKS